MLQKSYKSLQIKQISNKLPEGLAQIQITAVEDTKTNGEEIGLNSGYFVVNILSSFTKLN